MSEGLQAELDLPILHYTHPEKIGDIALVGMIHAMPDDRLYRERLEFIEQRQTNGSFVHCEGISPATHAELGRADKLSRRKYALLSTTFEYESRIFDLFACNQGKILDEENRIEHKDKSLAWENHDINALQLVEKVPIEYLAALSQEMINMWSFILNLTPEQRGVYLNFKCSDQAIESIPGFPVYKESKAINKVLEKYDMLFESIAIQDRDKIAIGAVRDALEKQPEASFTLVWGSDHLPGIGEGLEKLGYQKLPEEEGIAKIA